MPPKGRRGRRGRGRGRWKQAKVEKSNLDPDKEGVNEHPNDPQPDGNSGPAGDNVVGPRRPGRPRKTKNATLDISELEVLGPRKRIKREIDGHVTGPESEVDEPEEDEGEVSEPMVKKQSGIVRRGQINNEEDTPEGLHMTTSQVEALSVLVACRECGHPVTLGVRPTTKGMITEFTVHCVKCGDIKTTNTPNWIRERKRKRERHLVLQKTENVNYAHVAAFLDNGLGYSGLRHYCRYFNARCLNEATFVVYARQVVSDVVIDTDDSLQYAASVVREVFRSQLETDEMIDLTVSFVTTYHQWGSDFCLVAGAVIELQTGLVLDYDVANMYCHVCKINAKKIVNMSPGEMTDWFNRHQDVCEIREWCDELDHEADEGVREIEPKYLECFIAKKIWSRSAEKYGFRYTTLIHESDERVHTELSAANIYDGVAILIDGGTSCFSRRKSEHARTTFQNKLKGKCPRERVQTKERILYVYAMAIPEYNRFAISSNIRLRELVRFMEEEANCSEPSSVLGELSAGIIAAKDIMGEGDVPESSSILGEIAAPNIESKKDSSHFEPDEGAILCELTAPYIVDKAMDEASLDQLTTPNLVPKKDIRILKKTVIETNAHNSNTVTEKPKEQVGTITVGEEMEGENNIEEKHDMNEEEGEEYSVEHEVTEVGEKSLKTAGGLFEDEGEIDEETRNSQEDEEINDTGKDHCNGDSLMN